MGLSASKRYSRLSVSSDGTHLALNLFLTLCRVPLSGGIDSCATATMVYSMVRCSHSHNVH